MTDDIARLRQLLREGKCCAAALVQLGLELRGEANEQLVAAASVLCNGVRGERLCGALTGAACLMAVHDPAQANARMVPELTAWFVATMGERHGGTDCRDILERGAVAKATRCPALIEETYRKARQIMTDHGVPLSDPQDQ
ncbi:MAG TPA: C-GCAxxG-C-C family protein [Candidatus Edwardsbacteria bacterium]|nr:C-GCAxxG-C-C family protein [Candidatus Edwardsbacteria bacterium]